ncbi:Myb-like DNA-binding domain [Musa troglodytarum]|uniref:Myb-like DNA-binding domain n=1 Tax=Musa troglodytarum TaxID=320322 RepID=A0A9E7JQE5_9LILI|nr:Myb-like DNA-binding domain [Musa troglodytarum]
MVCKACEKPKVSYKKGLWSPDEDQRLRDFILKHGHGRWSSVPARAGKSFPLAVKITTHLPTSIQRTWASSA